MTTTEMRCERCGAMGVGSVGLEGVDLTADDYAALARMAGMVILCDQCAGQTAG